MTTQSGLERDLLGCASYDIAENFADWCRRFGWDQGDPQAQRLWARYHEMYMKLWKYLGHDEFFQRLEIAKTSIRASIR